jgi:hypothetical protein
LNSNEFAKVYKVSKMKRVFPLVRPAGLKPLLFYFSPPGQRLSSAQLQPTNQTGNPLPQCAATPSLHAA